MLPFLSCLLILCRLCPSVALKDLETAAITVYRNPDFFRHLSDEFNSHVYQFSKDPYNYGPKDNYESPADSNSFYNHLNEQYENTFPDERGHQEENNREVQDEEQQEEDNENYSDVPENHRERYREEEAEDEPERENEREEEPVRGSAGYKYPGEPKKPNPPIRPSVNVHFDGAPDFGHPGRNVPPPKTPKKKGRGPYGHPQFHEHYNPNYSEEYEEDRNKSEEEQLEEIEDESRRHNEENGLPPPQRYYNEYSKTYPYNNEEPRKGNSHLPLKIYHQGQKYPIEPEEYDGYENVQHPLKADEIRFPSKEIRDTKKGTREYLRHAALPSHHELHDSETQKHQKPKRVVKVNCDTRIKPKKKNIYVAYKVRPVYNYRVPYSAPKKYRKIYYVQPGKGHYRRRSTPTPTSKLVEDDSAYVINSELDQDYQRLEVVRTKQPQ